MTLPRSSGICRRGRTVTPSIIGSPLPQLPRGVAPVPKVLEQPHVPDCVHALSEIIVSVGDELSLAGQTLQRLLLKKGRVSRDIIDDARLEHEKASVDPAVADLRLLDELCDPVTPELERSETRGGPHRGHRRKLAVG